MFNVYCWSILKILIFKNSYCGIYAFMFKLCWGVIYSIWSALADNASYQGHGCRIRQSTCSGRAKTRLSTTLHQGGSKYPLRPGSDNRNYQCLDFQSVYVFGVFFKAVIQRLFRFRVHVETFFPRSRRNCFPYMDRRGKLIVAFFSLNG